MVTSNSDCK